MNMLAMEKSQSPRPLYQTGQVPMYEAEASSSTFSPTVRDPTVNEKDMPLQIPGHDEPAPPPAYDTDEVTIPITTMPSPPSSSSASRPGRLQRPIAIPAIDSTFDAPFIRSYPPELLRYKLPKDSFLSFLDSLNAVVASSPPLQVLDATGGMLKQVPVLFPLRMLGAVVSGLANLGSLGVTKSRSDSLIKTANKDMFRPRGLKVEIAKLDALAHVAGIPIIDSKGKVNKSAPIYLSMSGSHVATVEGGERLDAVRQQMKTLDPFIAPLELETLPWTSKSRLTRFNAALRKRNACDYSNGKDSQLQSARQAAVVERSRKLSLADEEYKRQLLELDEEEERARSSGFEQDKLRRILSNVDRDRGKLKGRFDDECAAIHAEYSDIAEFKSGLWLVIRDL